MWAHGKFLTDAQAQAIINKIDQKQDGKVKHILFQFYFSQGLQIRLGVTCKSYVAMAHSLWGNHDSSETYRSVVTYPCRLKHYFYLKKRH